MKLSRSCLVLCLASLPVAIFASPPTTSTNAATPSQAPVRYSSYGIPLLAQPSAAPIQAASPASTNIANTASPVVPFDVSLNREYIYTLLDQSLDVPKTGLGWGKWLQVSGIVNTDASYWSAPYFDQGTRDRESTSYFGLATANLNLDSHLGSWVRLHVGGLYTNGNSPAIRNFRPARPANHQVNLEDAYATLANFQKTPFYLKAGQMFTPFGRYQRYPVTQSLTQILTQTDLPAVQAGYVSQMGIFASVYGLSGEHKFNHNNSDGLTNYGATVGYQNFRTGVDYDVGVGYLNNLSDVDAMRSVAQLTHGYVKSVPGVSAYGDIYAGPFGFGARYMTATTRFSPVNYAYFNGNINLGAKPYAADFDASFKFDTRGHHSMFDVFYQLTGQASNLAPLVNGDNITRLAVYRYGASYAVKIIKDLAFTVQWYQDKNYPTRNGGNSKRDNVLTGRLSFAF